MVSTFKNNKYGQFSYWNPFNGKFMKQFQISYNFYKIYFFTIKRVIKIYSCSLFENTTLKHLSVAFILLKPMFDGTIELFFCFIFDRRYYINWSWNFIFVTIRPTFYLFSVWYCQGIIKHYCVKLNQNLCSVDEIYKSRLLQMFI